MEHLSHLVQYLDYRVFTKYQKRKQMKKGNVALEVTERADKKTDVLLIS